MAQCRCIISLRKYISKQNNKCVEYKFSFVRLHFVVYNGFGIIYEDFLDNRTV